MLIQQDQTYVNGELLDKHNLYMLEFTETVRPLPITFKIVRVVHSHNGINYGCKFIDITENDSDELYKYVLKIQIYNIKKKQELEWQ